MPATRAYSTMMSPPSLRRPPSRSWWDSFTPESRVPERGANAQRHGEIDCVNPQFQHGRSRRNCCAAAASIVHERRLSPVQGGRNRSVPRAVLHRALCRPCSDASVCSAKTSTTSSCACEWGIDTHPRALVAAVMPASGDDLMLPSTAAGATARVQRCRGQRWRRSP